MERWNEMSYQKEFLDFIARDKNITAPEHWYAVTTADVIRRGGGYLLGVKYKHSMTKMLSSVYPSPYHITSLLYFDILNTVGNLGNSHLFQQDFGMISATRKASSQQLQKNFKLFTLKIGTK